MTALVTGAGGFIGGHLVKALLRRGEDVRCADIKPLAEWKQVFRKAKNLPGTDLAIWDNALAAADGCDTIYHLAAQAGGMGYISTHKADCTASVLADTQMIRAALEVTARIWYASSACVYPLHLQQSADAPDLAEDMAYPPDPEEAYGWEKLFAERMYLAYAEDYGVPVRIGRYQSVYGPDGVWRGGREKAPTAICRKIAEAKVAGAREIEVWGDGSAIRTFTYVDDAVAGTLAVTASDYGQPLNVGSDETASVEELVALVEDIAGYRVARFWNDAGPVGVPGRRGCDTTLVREKAGWHAKTSLRKGLEATYKWVQDQVQAGQ
jgi:nucleoside-diphosphate-sugar epimerase